MKKRFWIILVAVALLATLIAPLWAHEKKAASHSSATAKPVNSATVQTKNDSTFFFGTVTEINGITVVVDRAGGTVGLDRSVITFSMEGLEKLDVKVGSIVKVTYTGEMEETDFLPQVHATRWELVEDLRKVAYPFQWLDKSTATKFDYDSLDVVEITAIYADCFFVTFVNYPYQIKINGTISDDWCVGDWVSVTLKDPLCSKDNEWLAEADLLTIAQSTWRPDPNVCYKPVIYLYPEHEMKVSVKLDLNGKLTCTYPAYNTGWTVTALPDGTLIDVQGRIYNYLYWEGETHAEYDLSHGFCVKGEDTAAFLEEALEKLGLNRREANEFIVYWLPLMEQNPYNVISFQTDAYTNAAKLGVDPAPDTLIRVFMTWQASDSFVELPAQELTAPARTGFTVVEWGGTELR